MMLFKLFLSIVVLFLCIHADARGGRRGPSSGGGSSSAMSKSVAAKFTVVADKVKSKVNDFSIVNEEVQKLYDELQTGKESFDVIYKNFLVKKYKNENVDLDLHLDLQAVADYDHTRCLETKDADVCSRAKRNLDFFVSMRKVINPDFTYVPQILDIPVYDKVKRQLSFNQNNLNSQNTKPVVNNPAEQPQQTTQALDQKTKDAG